jgi:hypothetical protein
MLAYRAKSLPAGAKPFLITPSPQTHFLANFRKPEIPYSTNH